VRSKGLPNKWVLVRTYVRTIVSQSPFSKMGKSKSKAHWKIAAEAGCQRSINELKAIYNADGKKPC